MQSITVTHKRHCILASSDWKTFSGTHLTKVAKKRELQEFRVPISFSLHHQPLDAFQNDLPSQCYLQLGAEDGVWHILFKYFENGHISDHFLYLSLNLISELLKKKRPSKTKVVFASIYWALADCVGTEPVNLEEKWIITIILYNIY